MIENALQDAAASDAALPPTFSHAVFPLEFHLFSIASLALGGVCMLIVLVDIVRHPSGWA